MYVQQGGNDNTIISFSGLIVTARERTSYFNNFGVLGEFNWPRTVSQFVVVAAM